MNRPAVTERSELASGLWQGAVCLWPDDEALVWARDLMGAVLEDTAVKAVVATGSAVRDVDHSDDLDLVVVYATARRAQSRSPRLALRRPPISVDLRCYDHAHVAAGLKAGHSYLSWAVRFGRALFERDRWWSRLRNRWNDRLLLPCADEADELARRAEHQRDALAAAGDDDAAAELHLAALTHRARAALSGAAVFPRSRPELSAQLRTVGEHGLAERLDEALSRRLRMSSSPHRADRSTAGDASR